MDQLVQILAQIQELSTVALEALEAALGSGGGEAPPGEGAPPEGPPPEGPPPGAGPPPEEPAP